MVCSIFIASRTSIGRICFHRLAGICQQLHDNAIHGRARITAGASAIVAAEIRGALMKLNAPLER